jgi:hypothetical protein
MVAENKLSYHGRRITDSPVSNNKPPAAQLQKNQFDGPGAGAFAPAVFV